MSSFQIVDDLRVTRLSQAVNYLLIAIVVTALMGGPIGIVYLLTDSPYAWFILPICFLVAAEGLLTSQWLASSENRGTSRYQYRFAEWIFILLVLRMFTWAVVGPVPTLAAWKGYLLAPLSFFDGPFVLTVLLALFAWERSISWSTLVASIYLTDAEVYYYSLSAHDQDLMSSNRPVDLGRAARFSSLISNWIVGAMILVSCAAISTISVPASVWEQTIDLRSITRLGLQPGIMISMFVYFITGLWLVGRVRMVSLRTRWIVGGIKVQSGLQRVWNRSSFLVITIIAFLALFLPIGSTLGISTVLSAIAGIALFLASGLIAFFSTLLYFLINLFASGEEVAATPIPVTPAPVITPAPAPAELSGTAAFVLGSTFWALVLVIVVVSLLFFLRGRGFLPDSSKLRKWLRSASDWLQQLWRGARSRMADATAAVAARRKQPDRAGAVPESRWRFIRVNALSPREQIRYFYLSTVRRAADRGVARTDSATPLEFADELKDSWPDADGEIEELTEAFLLARYSAEPIAVDDALPAKRSWKSVRSAIRKGRE